jgi:hypothetical protein
MCNFLHSTGRTFFEPGRRCAQPSPGVFAWSGPFVLQPSKGYNTSIIDKSYLLSSRFLSFFILSLMLVTGLSLWVVPASDAEAATYYVATTGSDSNSGTAASPFRTIEHGVTPLRPGGTLLVKNGTYTAGWGPGMPPAGTSWASPVTLKAYPGHRLVIVPPGSHDTLSPPNNPTMNLSGTQYVIIDGFVLDGKRSPVYCPDTPGGHPWGEPGGSTLAFRPGSIPCFASYTGQKHGD